MKFKRKPKLIDELLFFYAIINTNVQLFPALEGMKDREQKFVAMTSAITGVATKVIFDKIDAQKITKSIQKKLKIKEIWTKLCEEGIKKYPQKEAENADYFT